MALPNIRIQTHESTQLAERVPPESEKHIINEFSQVVDEVTEIFTRARSSGDKKVTNAVSFISREISNGKLSGNQLINIDNLPKAFRRVEEMGMKYTADSLLAQELTAIYIANTALQRDEIPIHDKIEIATFALTLTSSSISSKEIDVRAMKMDRSDGYKPGAVMASVNGLLSYMLTSRSSENAAIRNVAESVEQGMSSAMVFLEKHDRHTTAQTSVEIAKGIRGEMVATETLTKLADTVNICLDAFNGHLSEDVYEILYKVGKNVPDVKKAYPAEELTFYERAANISFMDIYENKGWIVLTEKIKELRGTYYPYFELARRLSTQKQVTRVEIIRTPSEKDYLGFSDFEIVGFKPGKQENTRYKAFQLPVDVKTLSGRNFEESIEHAEAGILSDLVHSETISLTGRPDEDASTLNSLERPPSSSAINHLSETKQPILMLRIKADAVSNASQEITVQSHDENDKKVFATVQKAVDLQAIPHASSRDLATLAYSVASSAELRGG